MAAEEAHNADRIVLLVAGSGSVRENVERVRARLLARGYGVRLVEDHRVSTRDLLEAQLVFVTSSARPDLLGLRLRDLRVPALVASPGLFRPSG